MKPRHRIVLRGREYGRGFHVVATSHPAISRDSAVWLRWTGNDLQIIEDSQKDAERIFQVLNLKGVSFRPCLDDAEHPPREGKDHGRRLGLCVAPCQNGLYLQAQGFVGITRIPYEGGELILQVKPRLENLDVFRMLVEVLSHPEVAPHVNVGQTYEIYTDEPPVDLDVPATDFLPFLLIHYLQMLDALLKRGLHRGHRRVRERLRGRVRGRLLVGATLRPWARRGYLYDIEVASNLFTPDNLENRILKAAFLKARAYLFHHRLAVGPITTWMGRIQQALEEVSTIRIFPYMFSHLQVVRIRKDYNKALDLARLILRNLGYDPTTLQAPAKLPVYPYWIDMPELFERYVEVQLRRGRIKTFQGSLVFPGYGQGEGIHCPAVGEQRPDFVLVNPDGTWAIADAKYKTLYESDWNVGDLRQVALYGRLCRDTLIPWLGKRGYSGELQEAEPNLYILYPCAKGCPSSREGYSHAEGFRGMAKIGVPLPLRDPESQSEK